MKRNLVILAAGLGSRYGGLKQVDTIGPNGEAIIDYSIYDAGAAGFEKIIFVVREDIQNHFKKYMDLVPDSIEVVCSFQPDASIINPDRTKPWGTGHAVLSASEYIDGPFTVINADDFYGKDAYRKAIKFFSVKSDRHAIIPYPLKHTLSPFGPVSRAVCSVDANGYLLTIDEYLQIEESENKIVYHHHGQKTTIDPDTLVSMNFWCFQENAIGVFKRSFKEFLERNITSMNEEFLIPHVAQSLLDSGSKIFVDKTNGSWFGITYKEDRAIAVDKLHKMIKEGLYPEKLW